MQSECSGNDVAQHRAEADTDWREYGDIRPVARAETRNFVFRAGLNFHGAGERRRVRANVKGLLQL